jgi:hypothetical protein
MKKVNDSPLHLPISNLFTHGQIAVNGPQPKILC